MIDRTRYLRERNLCYQFGHGYVPCEAAYHCHECVFAQRMRAEREQNSVEAFLGERDVLKQTSKGGGALWYRKPIVLKPECLDWQGLPRLAVNQIAVAFDGPGVFAENKVGEVDCYLYVDSSKRFTIHRFDAFGIPTETACRRMDRLFLWSLTAEFYKKGGDAYDFRKLIKS